MIGIIIVASFFLGYWCGVKNTNKKKDQVIAGLVSENTFLSTEVDISKQGEKILPN